MDYLAIKVEEEGAFAGSWVRSGAAGTPVWDAGIESSDFTYWATVLAPASVTTEDASVLQKQSTEDVEPTVELLPVEFQELMTVKDEEIDLAHEEDEQLNSAQRYMGMDMKVDHYGSLVFWDTVPFLRPGETTENGSCPWALYHIRDLDKTPGFWLQIGSALAVVAIWE